MTQADSRLAFVLQLSAVHRDCCCSLICWEAASRPVFSSSLQAACRQLCPVLHSPLRLERRDDLPQGHGRLTSPRQAWSREAGDAGGGCCGEGMACVCGEQGGGLAWSAGSLQHLHCIPVPARCCDYPAWGRGDPRVRGCMLPVVCSRAGDRQPALCRCPQALKDTFLSAAPWVPGCSSPAAELSLGVQCSHYSAPPLLPDTRKSSQPLSSWL